MLLGTVWKPCIIQSNFYFLVIIYFGRKNIEISDNFTLQFWYLIPFCLIFNYFPPPSPATSLGWIPVSINKYNFSIPYIYIQCMFNIIWLNVLNFYCILLLLLPINVQCQLILYTHIYWFNLRTSNWVLSRAHDASPFRCLFIYNKHSVASNCLDLYIY